jgi:hypothetical protein
MLELGNLLDRVIGRIGKTMTVVVLLAVAMGAIWWGYSTFASGKSAKVEAKLGREQTGAALESGRDAVGTVAGVNGNGAETDAITRSNEHDIRTAPGASAPVDPAVAAAGRRSLCRRAANRDRPECLQHAPAE